MKPFTTIPLWGQAAARAGQGARPVPPPRAESGPGGGRKRPPPPPRPQRAAPAPARGPPPRSPRGGLLPPSRGSGEGARPRRRRWRRLRLGWLPPRGREAAVSLAPRHPPPPAANPHPGWGEGDANYPGSGSARPPPPRPGPVCTRPLIPGLPCTARPPGPPPSPGSAGRKPGTATGPRQGEPGSRPRLRAGRPRLRAAPRDQPALIGSLARHSPPLLRTAPTRGPRRDGGAAHPGTCSPSSLPPASCNPLPPIPHGAQSWPTPTYARSTE
ncbi:basic proline-rich protein-like [Sus scrofa]|uniref:basic proline-rich protein-like n=1 Tax=Sus scrofa TaxID=9823 RepID=UPI000A2B0E28|nr:basic proline-rich protein-like [Sus scrofa]